MNMVPFRISPFIATEANGSDISNPDVSSGYEIGLSKELARVGCGGGVLSLNAAGLNDLAEWLDTMEISLGQEGNGAGARSCATHSSRARQLSKELVDEGGV